jgi:hypothetical protein
MKIRALQPADQSAGMLWIMSVALFLGSSEIHQNPPMTHGRLRRTGLSTGSVRRVYVDWRGKHTCRVYCVFPCRVYIDSNYRDSQI